MELAFIRSKGPASPKCSVSCMEHSLRSTFLTRDWTVVTAGVGVASSELTVGGATGPWEVIRPLPTPWWEGLWVFCEGLTPAPIRGFVVLFRGRFSSPEFLLFCPGLVEGVDGPPDLIWRVVAFEITKPTNRSKCYRRTKLVVIDQYK